ncbi:MAG: hypothetical protein AAFR49_04240 [Pseudomonadota bacterium]
MVAPETGGWLAIVSLALIWLIAILFAGLIYQRESRKGLRAAGNTVLDTLRSLAIRLPCALLTAMFLVQITPVAWVANIIGPNSGALGILIAAAAGGFLPGGPMASFPIVVFFQQAGAGVPQLVALLAGWSVYALNRTLSFEAPIMGWRFVALRGMSCLVLPILAGFPAEILVKLTRISDERSLPYKSSSRASR